MQFIGHDVPTQNSKDMLQMAKLSKLFLLMEQGNVRNFLDKLWTMHSFEVEVMRDEQTSLEIAEIDSTRS